MATTALPTRARPRSQRQVKFLLGALVIFGVIGYLIVFGIQSTQQYYLSVGELQAKSATMVGQGVRVGGNLVSTSVVKDVKGNQISFAITDGSAKLPIKYGGVVPDTFEKATEVIAEGKLGADGTFTASMVLAKCPSKYDESKLEWHTTSDPGALNYDSSASGK